MQVYLPQYLVLIDIVFFKYIAQPTLTTLEAKCY